MTYHSDPARWTQSQGPADDGASELLRSAFHSGTREGPSELQMHALSLKLAAVGTGAAVAAGAASAHASTTAAGLGSSATVGGAIGAAKTGGALTLTKLALSVALVGATATGTVVLQRSGALDPTSARRHQATQQAQLTPQATASDAVDVPGATLAPTAQPVTNTPADLARTTRASGSAAVVPTQAPAAELQPEPPLQPTTETLFEPENQAAVHAESASSSERRASRAARHRAAHASGAARPSARSVEAGQQPIAAAQQHAAATPQPTHTAPGVQSSLAPRARFDTVTGQRQQLSEIELLGKARSALAAHPRDAYRLAQEHKALYPQGVFAQERDALAVEAAQRAGELKLARQLADSFVQHYPGSPHAHRFRETMNLQ